jgi:menaquinone-dependent protoporphyrinogen oxidase
MKRILVTYATRAGSTAEVAAGMAEVLRTTGASVDLKPVPAVYEVSGYDAVVLGSAIRMGCLLPEAITLVRVQRSSLSHIPIAYFVMSGLLREETPAIRRKVLAALDAVRQLVEPSSIGLFAGKIDYSTMNWYDRSIAEAVSSSDGDWRDWEAIGRWAREVASILTSV